MAQKWKLKIDNRQWCHHFMPFQVHLPIIVGQKSSCEYRKGSLTWKNDSSLERAEESEGRRFWPLWSQLLGLAMDDADMTELYALESNSILGNGLVVITPHEVVGVIPAFSICLFFYVVPNCKWLTQYKNRLDLQSTLEQQHLYEVISHLPVDCLLQLKYYEFQ